MPVAEKETPKQTSISVIKSAPQFEPTVELHQTTVSRPPATDIGAEKEGIDQHGRAFRVIDGRKINRSVKVCPHTNREYLSAGIDAIKAGNEVVRGPNGAVVERRHLSREVPGVTPNGSPAAAFNQCEANKLAIYVHKFPRPINPLRDEIAKLSKDYPRLGELLMKAHVKPDDERTAGLFPLGPVKYSPSVDKLRIHPEELEGFLSRHLEGDHGILGSSVNIEPTELSEWAPSMADILYRNDHSIKTGFGIVTSKYNIYSDADRIAESELRATRPNVGYHRRPDDLLIVETLVAGDQSKTIVVTSRDSASTA